MSYGTLIARMFFFSSVRIHTCACAVLVSVVRPCDHRNDMSDLFPPAFINSQVVHWQAVGLGILKPVVPV